MQNEQYTSALEQAVYSLHNAETQLFTAMVNLGFSGVYNEISQLHEPGESINLELAMFENTGDINLDHMVEVIGKVIAAKNSLINLNNLEVELEDDEEEEDLEDDHEDDQP
jgi:hypothetical protein